ncbi:hypothetical protein GLOTRDRAFT_34856, partial [Gloeophyllum trabeum ATCC 11539]
MSAAVPHTANAFSSPEGRIWTRSILRKLVPFDPHDYQLEGVCKCLDGVDLFAITATGDGKTGYFYMYILMVIYLSNNSAAWPKGTFFPQDPVIIVVCPTNGIEEQMASKMTAFGLRTLAVNSHTLHEAAERKEDLWVIARTRIAMLMLSPEQLVAKGFKNLLSHEPFWRRIVAMGVDEAHLLLQWGKGFRKAFLEIGFMRARLPSRAVVMAVTATMAPGKRFGAVCELLGYKQGAFHEIRRSNFRPEIQLLFRPLNCGIGGRRFPSLLWVL